MNTFCETRVDPSLTAGTFQGVRPRSGSKSSASIALTGNTSRGLRRAPAQIKDLKKALWSCRVFARHLLQEFSDLLAQRLQLDPFPFSALPEAGLSFSSSFSPEAGPSTNSEAGPPALLGAHVANGSNVDAVANGSKGDVGGEAHGVSGHGHLSTDSTRVSSKEEGEEEEKNDRQDLEKDRQDPRWTGTEEEDCWEEALLQGHGVLPLRSPPRHGSSRPIYMGVNPTYI